MRPAGKTRALEAAEDPPVFKLLRNPTLGPIMRSARWVTLGARGALKRRSPMTALVDDAMVNRYVQLARAPGHREILLQMTLGYRERNYATAERLAALRMPVLIMHRRYGSPGAACSRQQFHDAIPGSQLITFEATGHIPQEERPDESATAANGSSCIASRSKARRWRRCPK
jgi:pimeloyl-ACP methyl ester carboxylesterase